MNNGDLKRILVTGGAGYVGAVLVPRLLAAGYRVTVLDLYLYGSHTLNAVTDHQQLQQVKGDIRDRATLERALAGCDAVIHLACISNDPSFDLDPELGKSVNYDAFGPLVDIARDSGVRRFIYASSSSVYGVKKESEVTEDLPLTPLTDYAKYKAMCEEVLLERRRPGFATLVLRPATACGYSPRLRLDLTVNILTNHAVNRGHVTVFGGQQMRPSIHIADMADLYLHALQWPTGKIDGQVFNVGNENHRVIDIAEKVRGIVGPHITIATTPTDDSRSYHISSAKIRREVGFVPTRSIEDAVSDLVAAFRGGLVPNAMTDALYYNVKLMQERKLK